MKYSVCFLIGGLALSGCARHTATTGGAAKPTANAPGNRKLIVTPETSLAGRVLKVNENGRFVILNFAAGNLPAAGRQFQVYRAGLKVGEVKITGPQQGDNTVADIVSGEIREGDEAREN